MTRISSLEAINKDIEKCKRSFVDVDMTWQYEDNKSQRNRLSALGTQKALLENNIEYSDNGTHIYTIIHPLSNQIIKLSSKGKGFVNGKWIDITFSDIKKWYNNDTNNKIDTDNKKQESINSGDTLLDALKCKNKTTRRKILSKFLQKRNIGEIIGFQRSHFILLYFRFYSNVEERSKFKAKDIQNITIEEGKYNSKCFNLTVNNKKQIISIKKFN